MQAEVIDRTGVLACSSHLILHTPLLHPQSGQEMEQMRTVYMAQIV